MSQYLFLFTITPVQSFISAARKTQDLYAGSYILSHLCRTAIRKSQNDHKADVIFPNTKQKSLPNRMLAIFDVKNDEELTNIGMDIEKTVLREFSYMGDKIICNLGLPLHEDLKKQIDNYFQVFWTFCPLKAKSYSEAHDEIESFLSAVKNVRKFSQLFEKGRKCSITGEHNVLYYKNDEDRHKKKKIHHAICLDEQISDKYLAPGEALGGIAFIKRCADKYFKSDFNSEFPSTVRIALMDALNKLSAIDSECKDIFKWKFEEQDIFELKNGAKFANDKIAEKVYEKLGTHKIPYSPYYAILVFDGDSMGNWLSGAKLKKDVSIKDFHKELSKKLGEFAKLAEEQILVLPKGTTVYAGGDDFLGFVNLNYLLELMKELRKKFEDTIDLKEFSDEKLTFSAGVAIAHFKTPLAETLTWAKKMELEAKKIDMNKNAFGLAVLKRSGEIKETVYKWRYDNEWITDYINKIINYIKNDFSSSFIRTFQLEFISLMDDEGKLDFEKIHDGMVKSELRRLIDRAYLRDNNSSKEEKQSEKKKKVNDLFNLIWKLYLYSKSFDNFLSLLDIVTFIERNVNQNVET